MSAPTNAELAEILSPTIVKGGGISGDRGARNVLVALAVHGLTIVRIAEHEADTAIAARARAEWADDQYYGGEPSRIAAVRRIVEGR